MTERTTGVAVGKHLGGGRSHAGWPRSDSPGSRWLIRPLAAGGFDRKADVAPPVSTTHEADRTAESHLAQECCAVDGAQTTCASDNYITVLRYLVESRRQLRLRYGDRARQVACRVLLWLAYVEHRHVA